MVSAEGRPREPRGEPGRHGPRFARFVSLPRQRHLVLSRLGLAVLSSIIALIVTAVVGWHLLGSLVRWLHNQPVYQTNFSAIELDPPPPDWYRGGSAGFLERVRQAVQREDMAFSALDVDLTELRLQFQRYRWVKRVRLERRSPNRIIAHLEYRIPVASAPMPDNPPLVLIDEEGVHLPWEDVDEAMSSRLISIKGLDPPVETGQTDERTLAGVKLAVFLQSALARSGKPHSPVLQPKAIYPAKDQENKFFILNREGTFVYWGESPGAESPGTLSAAEKWKMLQDWLPGRPRTPVRDPFFLRFTKEGVVIDEDRH
jgi:hypothetical protein